MSPGDRAPVSVVLVTHDSADHIGATLDALLSDRHGPAEVIVVDNGSTDGTAAHVAGRPVTWMPLGRNAGFAAGCHAGAQRATTGTLAFLNPDALPAPGWLPPLLDALGAEDVGAAMATIELTDRPGSFNTSGGELTYFGLAWITDLGAPIPVEPESVEVPFPSGAAMAVGAATWDRLGGFRTDLFMYHEDTDFGWRLRQRGLRTVRVPSSRVAHDYEFARNPRKMFLLERNRHLLLAANYRMSTALLLAPALALVELAVVAVAARDGWLRAKVAAWGSFLGRIPALAAAYRKAQSGRAVGDAAILETMGAAVAGMPGGPAPRGACLANRLLAGYLRLVLPVVRRLDRRRGLR